MTGRGQEGLQEYTEAGDRGINGSRLWAMTGCEGSGVASGPIALPACRGYTGHETEAKRHLRGGGGVGKEPDFCFVAKPQTHPKGSRHKAASPSAPRNGLIYQTHPGHRFLALPGCWP